MPGTQTEKLRSYSFHHTVIFFFILYHFRETRNATSCIVTLRSD